MVSPDDVYREIEIHQLTRLYLSSTYQCTERWTKDSLQFKVLTDFIASGDISYDDIFERLRGLAEKEFDKQYANPDDVPIYVYLLALESLNEPSSEEAEAQYHIGCEIVSKVENLHWARRHVSKWASHVVWDRTRPTD
ncbi:MAG: hypothetical protein IH898_12195 [Planctomycetes bacterium]|nr:hypothetical protein [Planctomycetota bacterium]